MSTLYNVLTKPAAGQLMRSAHLKLKVGDEVLLEFLPETSWWSAQEKYNLVVGRISSIEESHYKHQRGKKLPDFLWLRVTFSHPRSGLIFTTNVTLARTTALFHAVHPWFRGFVVHGAVVAPQA